MRWSATQINHREALFAGARGDCCQQQHQLLCLFPKRCSRSVESTLPSKHEQSSFSRILYHRAVGPANTYYFLWMLGLFELWSYATTWRNQKCGLGFHVSLNGIPGRHQLATRFNMFSICSDTEREDGSKKEVIFCCLNLVDRGGRTSPHVHVQI